MNNSGTVAGFHHLAWEVEEGIGNLILNRPPSNEMSIAFFDEMHALIPGIRDHQGLRGIIVTGAGRHFSSGAALDELLADISGNGGERLLRNARTMSFFEDTEIPVVAAIRGVCIGSAFEFALLCHYRVCSEDAVFGLPESTFNLLPGLGGIRRITRLAGKATALELALRGRTFGAAEALEMGLVDRIVPKRDIHDVSVSLIDAIATDYKKEKRSVYIYRYLC
jgi:enoyl-CoA hydratase